MRTPASSSIPFRDRAAAGSELAELVATHCAHGPVLVLALPRGGVPVAAPVARRLAAPLDVLVVRKVGMPGQPELAIGAVAPGGVTVRNELLPDGLVDEATFAQLAAREIRELQRRERTYRQGRLALQLRDRHVVLVDDGLATGATMLAAIKAARLGGAASITVAVPVASIEATSLVRALADATLVLVTPSHLGAVGEFYERFGQVSDVEVVQLLQDAAQ
ncbi:MAG TPA: phosphoribosyltransferase family protein [Steroidobacteraceae bacterium]|nr:phosphoribosyltransferase family protein [Steroidobacteraceae bacterium]